MTTPPMLRQMRHDVWATGKLLEHCQSLTAEGMQLTASVDEIASRLARVRDAVEQLFKSKELDFDRRIRDERRKADLELWVPLAQFSHHGSDHRSQIGTILTVAGLAVPELDVWAYATDRGAFARL